MAIPIPLAVCVVILLSAAIIVVVTNTGLQHTPFCFVPSLGIVVLIWMAYPPAQQLSPVVSILVWTLLTAVLYHFPAPQSHASTDGSPPATDDDLLEQFFQENT